MTESPSISSFVTQLFANASQQDVNLIVKTLVDLGIDTESRLIYLEEKDISEKLKVVHVRILMEAAEAVKKRYADKEDNKKHTKNLGIATGVLGGVGVGVGIPLTIFAALFPPITLPIAVAAGIATAAVVAASATTGVVTAVVANKDN